MVEIRENVSTLRYLNDALGRFITQYFKEPLAYFSPLFTNMLEYLDHKNVFFYIGGMFP